MLCDANSCHKKKYEVCNLPWEENKESETTHYILGVNKLSLTSPYRIGQTEQITQSINKTWSNKHTGDSTDRRERKGRFCIAFNH